MKVLYNACYGGFGLSYLATNKYAEKKGFELTWYRQDGYAYKNNLKYTRISGIPLNPVETYIPSKKDLGDEILGEFPDEHYYSISTSDSSLRTDIDLITIFEEIGELINSKYANIKIIEIPDDAKFDIDEYDGYESIVPPRPSW
jgi:hypothetical protein